MIGVEQEKDATAILKTEKPLVTMLKRGLLPWQFITTTWFYGGFAWSLDRSFFWIE